ncbi:MAG: cation diffusion facilitator family transporter [Bacteroidia bacterium]
MSHHHTENCHHTHTPPSQNLNGKFMLGIVLNALFIIAELIFSLESYANSNALFADAMHNVSDLLALAFSWLGIYFAQKKTAENYTYGLRKANILITFLNMLLLIWAIGEIINESVKYLWTDVSEIKGNWVIIVASVGVFVNGFTAWLFHSSGHGHHHHAHEHPHHHENEDLNLKSIYAHFFADALISLGVVLVGVLMRYTDWYFLDAYISIAIALFILYHCRFLIRQVIEYALDATPSHISLAEIAAWLAQQKGVTEVHDLHIWGISTTETALTVHLVMPNTQYEEAFLSSITKYLKEHHNIQHITIQVEKEPCGQNCANHS